MNLKRQQALFANESSNPTFWSNTCANLMSLSIRDCVIHGEIWQSFLRSILQRALFSLRERTFSHFPIRVYSLKVYSNRKPSPCEMINSQAKHSTTGKLDCYIIVSERERLRRKCILPLSSSRFAILRSPFFHF